MKKDHYVDILKDNAGQSSYFKVVKSPAGCMCLLPLELVLIELADDEMQPVSSLY